jgi:broad specificity phosphatase PhoE
VAIATHATPIRVAQSIIQTGGLDEMENIPWVSNASVTVFEYEKGTWRIRLISEDGHLSEIKTKLPKNV